MTPQQTRDPMAAPYVDICVLLSLFLNDACFLAAEQWFLNQGNAPLWVSHWVLVEFAGVVSLSVCAGVISPKIVPGPFTLNLSASAASVCNCWNRGQQISCWPGSGCKKWRACRYAVAMPSTWPSQAGSS